MRQFIGGIIVGAVMTGSLGLAGMYDQKGQPSAPRGSVQQFDYFRERQQQLDVQALRREADRQRLDRSQKKPCND